MRLGQKPNFSEPDRDTGAYVIVARLWGEKIESGRQILVDERLYGAVCDVLDGVASLTGVCSSLLRFAATKFMSTDERERFFLLW